MGEVHDEEFKAACLSALDNGERETQRLAEELMDFEAVTRLAELMITLREELALAYDALDEYSKRYSRYGYQLPRPI